MLLADQRFEALDAAEADNGWTVLHYAAIKGNGSLCKAILQNKRFAAANADDHKGRSAFELAALTNRIGVCQVLLNSGRCSAKHDIFNKLIKADHSTCGSWLLTYSWLLTEVEEALERPTSNAKPLSSKLFRRKCIAATGNASVELAEQRRARRSDMRRKVNNISKAMPRSQLSKHGMRRGR